MTSETSSYARRLPLWVLIGALAGVAIGLFFGDQAKVLQPVGQTYVKLMEVVVFPYIICSLLHGLGRLSPDTAWRLFRCSWLVYLVVWGTTFLIIFLLSIAIPEVPPPSFINANAPQEGPGLLDHLIPSNPFLALARNYVPAVVVFSIVYGIAIQRIDNKETFLDVLDLIRGASVTIWRWVVLLAPFGVCALFAKTAGTLDPTDLADLSLYLLVMIAGTVILAFWILPSLISAVCPVTTREVIRDVQNGLVIAVVTSLSVAALPFIQQAAEKLAEQQGIKDENRGEIIKTTLAVSYPLAQLGNFFIWLFVLFGAYYYRVPLSDSQELSLPFVSLLSGIGSPSSSIDAVDFLVSWLQFPADATGLYVGMMTITRYGQVVASVMGFTFVTFLVTLHYYGHLKLRVSRLMWSLGVSIAAIAIITTAGRFIQDAVVDEETPSYLAFQLAPELTEHVTVVIEKPSDASQTDAAATTSQAGTDTTADTGGDAEVDSAADTAAGSAADTVADSTMGALARIQSTSEIRVGYNPNVIPFSYTNERGELVGYDIAYVYKLAQDLNVKLRLIPFEWQSLADDLADGRFDMAVSGIYVTDSRLQHLSISEPYLQSPLALIVRADEVNSFLSRDAILAQQDLVIGAFDDPVLVPLVKRLMPNADVKVVKSYDELPDHPDVDAAIWTLEQAKAWTSRRTDYTAVVPNNLGSPFLIAYLLPGNADQLTQFLNYWMRLQRTDGFHDRMVDHWIDGKADAASTPRWSIMRNVLGWGDE